MLRPYPEGILAPFSVPPDLQTAFHLCHETYQPSFFHLIYFVAMACCNIKRLL